MDPVTSPKTYRLILKTFLNNKNIPCIPPIYHNNNYITDFKEKTELLNNFFAKQCTIFNIASKLPTDSLKRTNNCLSTISFTKDDIKKITKNLDPNKAHGYDMISICILKICGESILKSLELIFKSCIESEKFASEWKKLMLSQFIKKWQTTKIKLSSDFVAVYLWQDTRTTNL